MERPHIREAVASAATRRAEGDRPVAGDQVDHLADMMRRGVPDSIADRFEGLERGPTVTISPTRVRVRDLPIG